MSPRMLPWSLIPGWYGDGIYFEGSTEEIEERARVRRAGAVIAVARDDDEQGDAGRPRVTCSHNPRLILSLMELDSYSPYNSTLILDS